MAVRHLIGFSIFVCLCSGSVPTKVAHEEIVNTLESIAVAGSVAKLPCDMTPPSPSDRVSLVIWYKEGVDWPIYSLDVRDSEDDEGRHWSDPKILGNRAFFHISESPAKLTLDGVKDKDGGLYRCRVDFRKTPTRNTKVNLTIIIPPERLAVVDEKGKHIQHYILGPYSEGASLDIACIATGGRPTPRVTWWQENALLDDSWEILSERRVRNVLRLERLERKHLHTVFTCQASNNNLVPPISSAVTLDLNLSPLWVRLLGDNRPLSADHKQEVRCETVGARPAPHITWWKAGKMLFNATQENSNDGNRTVSTLSFIPHIEDIGVTLTCKATSPFVAGNGLEDSWILNIYHVPIVSLEFGSSMNSSAIKEGSDVYLECIVKANPTVYRIAWKHNGKTLYNNGSAGLIVSNQSLEIQNVPRSAAGMYSCTASNQEGDGQSDPLFLDVKYSPTCRPGQQTVLGAARLEEASVPCEVEANPPQVNFTWRINGTTKRSDDVKFTVEGTRSIAQVTPVSTNDFGMLICWATNILGRQQEPCIYQLVAAGKPDSLSNCSIVNQTLDTLEVECEEGFDGGLPQEFVIEMYDVDSYQLIHNSTSPWPYFMIDPTPASHARRLDLHLYAVNKKGRSQVTVLHAYTLNTPERRTAAVKLKLTPFVGALLGMIGALVLIVFAVALALYFRSKENATPPNKRPAPSLDSLEKNPDIIPHCNDYQAADDKDIEKLLSCPSPKPPSPKGFLSPEKALEVIQTELSSCPQASCRLTEIPVTPLMIRTDSQGFTQEIQCMTLGRWRRGQPSVSATRF